MRSHSGFRQVPNFKKGIQTLEQGEREIDRSQVRQLHNRLFNIQLAKVVIMVSVLINSYCVMHSELVDYNASNIDEG